MKFLTYNPEQAYLLPPPACTRCWAKILLVSSCPKPWSGWTWARSSKAPSKKAVQRTIRRCCGRCGGMPTRWGSRRRGLAKVAVELARATTAFNLTRLGRKNKALDPAR